MNTVRTVRAGVIGASGYSGMELVRILDQHPGLSLRLATSDRWPGQPLGDHIAIGGEAAALRCVTREQAQREMDQVELLFLCTPAEVSIELATVALDAGVRVVDLSGAFRLAAADYPRWYGFEHSRPELLEQACYSMPEVTGRGEALRTAKLVSNPGCFPTACALAILPLLRAQVIEAEGIILDAKSGTTGTGRKASEELSFSEVDENLRPYRILRHQHTPEIERALALALAPVGPVVFTPHLLPAQRGILVTAYGRLRPGKTAADAVSAMEQFARDERFVRAVQADAVSLAATAHSNRVLVGADADPTRGVALAVASLDNLVKGAAGQAVQNANLMLGYDEALGLQG